VLALYRGGADAFTRDDLAVLQALGAGLGAAVEKALGSGKARASAARAGAD
jgi:GAF domain-containing protein